MCTESHFVIAGHFVCQRNPVSNTAAQRWIPAFSRERAEQIIDELKRGCYPAFCPQCGKRIQGKGIYTEIREV